jgi:hypothetical protein
MSDFDERPAAEIMAELANYDSADKIKSALAGRTPITAELLGKIVGPVLRQYVGEFRGKIADLTARIVALEAENEHLRARMTMIAEQRRRVRPVDERIARIERQMEEAENGGD